MANIYEARVRQSRTIVVTPMTAGRAAFGMRKALEQAGWQVIPTDNPASFAATARVCIVILPLEHDPDPQIVAAMSADFLALIPVMTAPTPAPTAQWTCEPFQLGLNDEQQYATGAAIAAMLNPRAAEPSATPVASQPTFSPASSASPALQSAPAPTRYQPSAGSATQAPAYGQYGALVGDYPANPSTYLYIPIGVIALLMGLTGWAPGGEWTTSSRWLLAFLGLVCFGAYYLFARGAHAQVFERGFVIARAGKVTSGRWEDIAQLSKQAKQWYLLAIIPIPGTVRHDYTILLRNGERVVLHNAYFSKVNQLANQVAGAVQQQRQQQTVATTPNSPPSS